VRRNGFQLFGKLGGALMAAPAKDMAEGKLAHLFRCRIDKLRLAIAERGTPEPGHAFDIFLALAVEDMNAFTALDDQRPRAAERVEIGVRVQDGFDVPLGGVRKTSHEILLDEPGRF
jgi:hypothetical protein